MYFIATQNLNNYRRVLHNSSGSLRIFKDEAVRESAIIRFRKIVQIGSRSIKLVLIVSHEQ